jgi:hypothetical protein
MPPDRPTSRIVAVQGTAQLTSAIAAMRAADRVAGSGAANHLVIHNLSCPEDQAQEFADCIGRLARLGADWQSVRYVSPAELRSLQALSASDGPKATATLQELIGVAAADSLFLGQNLLFLNHLLHRAFPAASRACYGDGIGLNFSTDYYRAPVYDPGIRGLGRRLERTIRRRIRAWRGRENGPDQNPTGKSIAHAVPFDRHYLLLANLFDEHLDEFVQLDAADFCELFAAYVPEVERAAVRGRDSLGDALDRASSVVVLLTSNFSETGRMTLQGEVECCIASVLSAGGAGPGSLLVIKPHPRDGHEKIARLATEARRHFAEVVTLDDRWTFHLPFESVFVRYFPSGTRIRAVTRVVCTSSAALSLEHLYGQECHLGFGPRAVRRCFVHNWQALRLRHEADLAAAIRQIRHRAAPARAA